MTSPDPAVRTFDDYLRKYRPQHREQVAAESEGDAVSKSVEESRRAIHEVSAELSARPSLGSEPAPEPPMSPRSGEAEQN
jgi:hypothetical protein